MIVAWWISQAGEINYHGEEEDGERWFDVVQTEANAQVTAQLQEETLSQRNATTCSGIHDRVERCKVDGTWKITECRAGLGWFYSNTTTGGKLMGTSNLCKGLLSLRAGGIGLGYAKYASTQQTYGVF